MLKNWLFVAIVSCYVNSHAQSVPEEIKNTKPDSTNQKTLLKSIGNGYYPTKYFNFDLRYLLKYNQYEGIRTGLGGVTNEKFSKRIKINGYTVYGFIDHRYKYSVGGSFKVSEKHNNWLNASYTDDLMESGSTRFLTDKRVFQFFEPRLLNVNLFHKHITKSVTFKHTISNKVETDAELAISDITPTYSYSFVLNNQAYNSFDLSTATVSVQWNPFDKFEISEKTNLKENKEGYPKFTFQYTKSFKDVFESDFNFSKLDFRTLHRFGKTRSSYTDITLLSGIASGNTPITHLYHAYPNNITKEKILQRFSVAGLNSFETMFFNEFFSDKFTTAQIKHYIKPFNITERYKPQLVLISRFAIGDIKHIERHKNMPLNSLKKGYTESGFEINKLLFGFGLSFNYRYGAYHLPQFDDNIAIKFTFNVTL